MKRRIEVTVIVVLVMAVVLLLFAGDSHALRATTVGGHSACFSKTDLKDLIQFAVDKDDASFQAYLRSSKCILLKKGFVVTIVKGPGLIGWSTQFAYNGVKLWTVREALENYR